MSPFGYRTRQSHFPRPVIAGFIKVKMLTCPACDKPTFLGVYKGWYVHHCLECKKAYKFDQCKHVITTFEITPT